MPSAAEKKDSAGSDSDDSSSMTLVHARTWNFDIDRYLNRFIPEPRWDLVPYPIAHFGGYRGHRSVPGLGNIGMTFWAFIGIFSAILLVELASRSIPAVETSGMLIVASFVSSQPETRRQKRLAS